MRTKLRVLVAGLGLFCLAVPAVAHHGFDGEYDAKKKGGEQSPVDELIRIAFSLTLRLPITRCP